MQCSSNCNGGTDEIISCHDLSTYGVVALPEMLHVLVEYVSLLRVSYQWRHQTVDCLDCLYGVVESPQPFLGAIVSCFQMAFELRRRLLKFSSGVSKWCSHRCIT